jgi:hypothetical protein
LQSDVAIGTAFSERVLVFLGAEGPEVPTVFEPEVDGLLGFLAAQITARFFYCADERFLHDGPQKIIPQSRWSGVRRRPDLVVRLVAHCACGLKKDELEIQAKDNTIRISGKKTIAYEGVASRAASSREA